MKLYSSIFLIIILTLCQKRLTTFPQIAFVKLRSSNNNPLKTVLEHSSFIVNLTFKLFHIADAIANNRIDIRNSFIPSLIIEKCLEQQLPCLVNFIDFKAAFDSFHRPSLWEILRFYGIPNKMINIIKNSYQDTTWAVKAEGSISTFLPRCFA